MKQIPLTQGQFAIVDDHWFDYLNQWKWHAIFNKDTKSFYALRDVGGRKNQKAIYMHRLVAKTPVGMNCDHIHHNTLDNRENELRNVTPSQSNMNMRLRRDNSLGIRGVRQKENGNFTTRLIFNGKQVLDKTVKSLDEALRLRKEAESYYFGSFASKE